MSGRIVTASGVLDILLTCTDAATYGPTSSLDFGLLQGRWLVHSWPNAAMRLFVNDTGLYPRPGMVLDFPKASRVSAESLPLLVDTHCVLLALDGKSTRRPFVDDPGRTPHIQWQRVCRSIRCVTGVETSLTEAAGFVSRVDGLLLFRMYASAAIPAGATIRFVSRCSGGDFNYLWLPMTLTGFSQRCETLYLMVSSLGNNTARITSGILYDFLFKQGSGGNIDVSLDVGGALP